LDYNSVLSLAEFTQEAQLMQKHHTTLCICHI